MAATLTTHDIEVEDIEYLRFGNKALLARLYKPARATDRFRCWWTCMAALGVMATG